MGRRDLVGPSQLERDGITRQTLRVGDSVRIWGSPSRNPNENRSRLKPIERRADGWEWRPKPLTSSAK
jgi:hypothetical protein